MPRLLNHLLLVLAVIPVLTDAAWIGTGHFVIDARGYALVMAPILLLACAAHYYDRRGEPNLSATLAVTCFLVVFPAAVSLMSYLSITVAGPRIDGLLASADLHLGFHWTALMALMADHPAVNTTLGFAYMSVMPQTLLLIFVLGLRRELESLYGMALALACGALITLAVWTAFPSFGAFSVFALPDEVASKLGLALGADYGRILNGMLDHGPGFITPKDIRGLVGFPSYHTIQALVLTWYARRQPYLRWALLGLNLVVLAAIPVHGGHHLMDMFGGVATAIAAVWFANRAVEWACRRRASIVSQCQIPASSSSSNATTVASSPGTRPRAIAL